MRLGQAARVGHGLTVGGRFGKYRNAEAELYGRGRIEARATLFLNARVELWGRGWLDTHDLRFASARVDLRGSGWLDGRASMLLAASADLRGRGWLDGAPGLLLGAAVDLRGRGQLEGLASLLLGGRAGIRGSGRLAAAWSQYAIELADFRFYLSTSRGVVPIIGGLPVFARASSAESEDPNGRTIEALPNTPQYVWRDLDGFRRPIVRLQPAHETDLGMQAVDRLYYPDGPSPDHDAYYLRAIIGWDPEEDAGHLLWMSDLVNATPHLRVRHAGDSFFARLHNGTAAVELEVEAAHQAGQVLEILVGFSEAAGMMDLIVALDGVLSGVDSGALPTGGLPEGWSASHLVLNGYNVAPSDAAYAEVKVVDHAAFGTGVVGYNKLRMVRDTVLSPAGELV